MISWTRVIVGFLARRMKRTAPEDASRVCASAPVGPGRRVGRVARNPEGIGTLRDPTSTIVQELPPTRAARAPASVPITGGMKPVATHVAVPLAIVLAYLAAISCEGEEDEPSYACICDYSVYSSSVYGSSFDEHTDECVDVSSAEECDILTKSFTDCTDGFCTSYTYLDVRLVPGTCDELQGYPGPGPCEWTNDGECDEPEGTGLCAEGSDVADCYDPGA
jgi:hypothetical protein